jgi:hypothetical protein
MTQRPCGGGDLTSLVPPMVQAVSLLGLEGLNWMPFLRIMDSAKKAQSCELGFHAFFVETSFRQRACESHNVQLMQLHHKPKGSHHIAQAIDDLMRHESSKKVGAEVEAEQGTSGATIHLSGTATPYYPFTREPQDPH